MGYYALETSVPRIYNRDARLQGCPIRVGYLLSRVFVTCLNLNSRYRPPKSPEDALIQAENSLESRSTTKDGETIHLREIFRAFIFVLELIDTYLNGPRILSNDCLSHLILSPPSQANDSEEQDIDILICVTHYIGDGMAVTSSLALDAILNLIFTLKLHQFAHDFFTLLGSEKSVEDLRAALTAEWTERLGSAETKKVILQSLHAMFCRFTGFLGFYSSCLLGRGHTSCRWPFPPCCR